MEVKNINKKQFDYLEKADAFMSLKTIYHFQNLLQLNPFRFNYHINKPIYYNFEILKKKGGVRKIQAPNEELKHMQQKLNDYLQAVYYKMKPKSVHGFIVNPFGVESSFNIISNARPHCNKKHLLNMDIKDFFNSITAKQIKQTIIKDPFKFNEEIATVVALLGSYEKKLPTGAPTSPVLSNMICYELDLLLEEFCEAEAITYTRYADDLTFSSNSKIDVETINKLKSLITNFGFELNAKKFRLQSSKSKQTVTGLIVNKKPNVDRKYIRQLRAILFSCEKIGVELAAAQHYRLTDFKSVDVSKFVNKIAGKIEFVGQVRGVDDLLYKKMKKQFSPNHS